MQVLYNYLLVRNDPLTLSIVIPAYNEEHHLRGCLDSIAAQTVMPDEVVVVDNNSTDGTVELAKSYPFVRVITEKTQGVLAVRNTGFSAVKSDIIARIDADNQMIDTWVEHLKEVFSLDKKLAAVTGPMYFYDMPLKEDNYFAEHLFKASLFKFDKNFPFLLGGNMAIRRTAWEAVRDDTCSLKDIHEDMDLAIHLHFHGKKLLYDPNLRVGGSARRFDDNPIKFQRYISMMTKTFKHHDLNPVGAHVAVAAYSLGYVSLWPLRRAYDPKTGKRSIKQLIRGHAARKNPMSSH